jgi:hypothetical protein
LGVALRSHRRRQTLHLVDLPFLDLDRKRA